MELEKKCLNDLRVVDLKRELEKRGLDKTGVKAVLTERLSKALEDEGLLPDTHLFELDEGKGSVKGDDLDKSIADDEVNESVTNDQRGSEAEEENNAEDTNQLDNDTKDNNDDEALLSINGENDFLGHEDDEDGGGEVDENVDHDAPEEYLSVHDDDGADFNAVDESENEKKGTDDNAEKNTCEESVPGDTKDTEQEDGEEKKEKEGNAESGVEGETDGATKANQATDASQGQPSAADDEKKKDGKSGVGANLWVSNLSSLTKATDLKRLFSRHGKLVGAKIVTSARTPGARCYGYITMANTDDADRCIEFLHRVELHGRLISVERAKDDATGPLRSAPPREHHTAAKSEIEVERERSKPHSQPAAKRSPARRSPRHDVLSFSKIKEERERQRRRDYERRAREMAKIRRDQEEEMRNRERQRRQRVESDRLEKEKQRLRLEREKLEREKDQLLRLERNRQRMERERLERERDEIRNRKKRLEERPPPPPARAIKRPADDKRPAEYGGKRSAPDKDDLMLEPPPPPRFTDQERSRDRSRRDEKRPSTRRDEFRHTSPQGHQRYARDKDRRGGKDDTSRDARSGSRYETSKDKNWQGNGTQYKAYTQSTGGGGSGGGSGVYTRDVWVATRPQEWASADGTTRWQQDGDAMGVRAYTTASMYGAAAYAQPSPPGIVTTHARYADPRFDAYAHSMPVRKY